MRPRYTERDCEMVAAGLLERDIWQAEDGSLYERAPRPQRTPRKLSLLQAIRTARKAGVDKGTVTVGGVSVSFGESETQQGTEAGRMDGETCASGSRGSIKPKRLADGTLRTYWYAWRGGPPLRGKPGTPEFIASYNEAVATKAATPQGALLSVLQSYQASGEFNGLAARTRRDYVEKIKVIEAKFGDFPLSALTDRRTRGIFMAWRDQLAAKSRRQADYAWQVLARVLSWAHDRGLVLGESMRTRRSALSRFTCRSRFGPPTTRPPFSNPRRRICICRCCSRCGPGSGKAICCACRGRPMTARTSDCGSQDRRAGRDAGRRAAQGRARCRNRNMGRSS